jgi:gamma-glutamyl:cysteine ligase YbdK (ATP-grasp superfamily)
VTAKKTSDKRRHWFVCRPCLHLIIRALALATLATLEHVCDVCADLHKQLSLASNLQAKVIWIVTYRPAQQEEAHLQAHKLQWSWTEQGELTGPTLAQYDNRFACEHATLHL